MFGGLNTCDWYKAMHKSTRGLLISLLYYQREFASFVLNANTFICTFEEVQVGDSTLEAVD